MRVIVARSSSFIPSNCKNLAHCSAKSNTNPIAAAYFHPPVRALAHHFILRKWLNEVPDKLPREQHCRLDTTLTIERSSPFLSGRSCRNLAREQMYYKGKTVDYESFALTAT